ncbi:MAG TPA: hypothetical protein VLC53_14085 [Myxococcota bacterium]|nr:hypothetical protein [Myxococcota bacterium]
MGRSRPAAALALCCVALPPTAGRAQVVEVAFTGSVSFVDPELAPAFSLADPVSGSVSYDLSTPDIESPPTFGLYVGAGSASWQFGSYGATDPTVAVAITDTVVDAFQASGNGPDGADVGDFELVATDLSLTDGSGNVFASDALPTRFTLDDFDSGSATLSFRDPDTQDLASVTASVTTLTVPEPDAGCAGVLATAALAGLARLGWRWRASARQGLDDRPARSSLPWLRRRPADVSF